MERQEIADISARCERLREHIRAWEVVYTRTCTIRPDYRRGHIFRIVFRISIKFRVEHKCVLPVLSQTQRKFLAFELLDKFLDSVEILLGSLCFGKLRRQSVEWDVFKAKCREFKFDKFLTLIDAFADVMEGKMEYNELQPSYKEEFDEIFKAPKAHNPRSWFGRRVELFFSILRNGRKYQHFGYTPMPSFLFNSVWTHFFDKEVKL